MLTHRAAALVLAVMSVGVLGGCTPTDEFPTPEPTASAVAPAFANEEEALAAARRSYEAYWELSASLGDDRVRDEQALRALVTPEQLDLELAGLEKYYSGEASRSGEVSIVSFEIQQASLTGSAPSLIAYVCIDVSQAKTFDERGKSTVLPNRPDIAALVATFDLSAHSALLADQESWTGDSFC